MTPEEKGLMLLTETVQRRAGCDLVDGVWGRLSALQVIKKFDQFDGNIPSLPTPTPKSREINMAGLALVKYFEGLYLTAYRDEVGVWTIGYGHTGLQHNDGTVHSGRTITLSEADQLLRYDMHQFESRVLRFVHVETNDNEFSALVSFDFNTGGLDKSTLLKLLNSEQRTAAADQFPRWNKAGGHVLNGLTKRRAAERDLFLGVSTKVLKGVRQLHVPEMSDPEKAQARMTPDSPD